MQIQFLQVLTLGPLTFLYWGLILTPATVATKNIGRAIKGCLFNKLISTFFGDLHFGRNNEQVQNFLPSNQGHVNKKNQTFQK